MQIKYWLTHPFNLYKCLIMSQYSFFLSDKTCVKICYRLNMKKKLNLNNPQTFNEKIQWLKLFDRNPLYSEMVDKSKAYSFAKKIGGEDINIVPQYGTWSCFDKIDFNILPNQFVLKCNHDSGSVVICKSKQNFNKKDCKAKLDKKIRRNFFWYGRQYHYKNIKPCIIAEKYMSEFEENMIDYKFLCFNGKAKMLYVAIGMDNHTTGQLTFYDINRNRLPFKLSDYENIKYEFKWPKCYEKMVKFAEKSAKALNAKFVRVDLYCIKEKIYFSEYTFYPTNGYQKVTPYEYDLWIGKMLKL